MCRRSRAIASSEAALEWTVDYATQRKMFGQTLADFQNTQFKLAEMKADLTMQRVFVDRCIELHLRHELDAVDAAMLKLVTAELQGKVMDQCLQFFGGWGYMTEYPIARAFVDARMGRIGGGSVETMKQIIARSMLPDNTKRKRRDGRLSGSPDAAGLSRIWPYGAAKKTGNGVPSVLRSNLSWTGKPMRNRACADGSRRPIVRGPSFRSTITRV